MLIQNYQQFDVVKPWAALCDPWVERTADLMKATVELVSIAAALS